MAHHGLVTHAGLSHQVQTNNASAAVTLVAGKVKGFTMVVTRKRTNATVGVGAGLELRGTANEKVVFGRKVSRCMCALLKKSKVFAVLTVLCFCICLLLAKGNRLN